MKDIKLRIALFILNSIKYKCASNQCRLNKRISELRKQLSCI